MFQQSTSTPAPQRLMTRRAFLPALLAGTGAVSLWGCSSASGARGRGGRDGSDSSTSSAGAQPLLTKPLDNGYSDGTHHARIVVRDLGTIELELDADVAPVTVSNFARLADERFYDGLTFHRVIQGFMIQGGDPNGNGTGGSPQRIVGEFSANGHANTIQHKRGVISMARARSYDSASSQFFIMQADSSNLDGQYAAFGKATSGMDVVDSICANTPVTDNNGTVAKADQPVIESVRMVD